MDFLIDSLNKLVWLSLVIALVQAYLKVNKLWIRRYDRNVADSVSVTAILLGLATYLPLMVHSAVVHHYEAVARTLISTVAALAFFAVGIGYWARRDERRHIWDLFRRAIKVERLESADLARGFLRPTGAKHIIKILRQVAMIDREYDEAEHRFIVSFARTWHLEYSDNPDELLAEIEGKSQDQLYIELRKGMINYLALDPPIDQVSQLRDVIRALIKADAKVTAEEEFIHAELDGLMDAYVMKREGGNLHNVLVVPQSPEQEESIRALLPDAVLTEQAGGRAFSVDSFYSRAFAEMICQNYRALKFFTTVESPVSQGAVQ